MLLGKLGGLRRGHSQFERPARGRGSAGSVLSRRGSPGREEKPEDDHLDEEEFQGGWKGAGRNLLRYQSESEGDWRGGRCFVWHMRELKRARYLLQRQRRAQGERRNEDEDEKEHP